MYQLGFLKSWIDLIMNCISTASLSVLINGALKVLIQLQRGLRQGCPLSPYLFIICAEAFSNLQIQAERKQLIKGLRFIKEISINHFLFTDDSLIFCIAATEDCKNLKKFFIVMQLHRGKFSTMENHLYSLVARPRLSRRIKLKIFFS